MTDQRFRPQDILAALNAHQVRYVLIGGLAATVHGSATPTFDVDIVPEPTADNLERLSAALMDLDARARVEGVDDGLPFAHDAGSLAAMRVLNLVTSAGDFDVMLYPAGVEDFTQWDLGATHLLILGVPTRVAALGDVIRSKEAADRPKDRATLPLLRELARRLERDRRPR
jgi:hypothetical protein